MKRRRLWLLTLVCLPVFPLLARVISYAPYTNRPSEPAYQSRTARWFALYEGSNDYGLQSGGEVRLYDATGAEEPRLIHPRIYASFVALYDRSPDPPIILIGAYSGSKLSVDGGTTWKSIPALTVARSPHRDLGGAHTYGPASRVHLGTPQTPFVIQMGSQLVTVTAKGHVRSLASGPTLVLNGRNARGSRFVIKTGGELATIDLSGRIAYHGTNEPFDYAWIANDGSIYAVERGVSLIRYRGSQQTTIARVQCCGSNQKDNFYAVPTHDYDGAWMILRGAGAPTSLLHYTPDTGLQTMWSDPAGPEVEALHPGRSGTTVLLQVHRERDVSIDVPFKDPALAVWRIGEGAPKEYDELFLNEAPTKQFVIVDPDKIADGAPFVFDSGFTEEGVPEEEVSAPIGGGGDVPQEWGVVRGSLEQHLVLPGVAHTPGAFGSFWMTDVAIYNPLEEPQNVALEFVPLGDVPAAFALRTTTITLNAREVRHIADVLGTMFGVANGGGALHIRPVTGVSVTSRTYTRKADGGTIGYGMPAIDFFNAAGPRFPMSFAGAFPAPDFRTNVLLTDTSGRGAEAEVTSQSIAVPTGGVAQLNGLTSWTSALVIQPTRGTAIPTVVAIDNFSNDATYFPPDLPGDIPRVIPIIGHVNGANGSRFRTDLYLYNPTTKYRQVILDAYLWDGETWKRRWVDLSPGESEVLEDVMLERFGMTGVASLQYTTREPGQGVRVTSRTYHMDARGATYGCLVPPLNSFQIAGPGERLEILGVGGGSGFRTNLGLVELTRFGALRKGRVRVHLRDGEGAMHSFEVEIPARGGTPVNDIFGSRGISTPKAGVIVVEVLDGLIGAYATLVDNITNDSTYLGAQLGAH